ncbi:MAG: LamG domain-containing protein, partial [Chloroflexaceae bacterium]|nr:LamG domain-containing protein [Chloroflexaceae bacterium]
MPVGTAPDTTTGTTTNSSPLHLGARGRSDGGFSNYFTGALDEIVIIERGLVAEEVRALVARGTRRWAPVALDQSGAGVIAS